MSIRYSVNGSTMTLDDATSEAWADKTEQGDRVGREVKRDARTISREIGKPVDIYSSEGVCLDVVYG